MQEFFGLMEEKGWILKLPEHADKMHYLAQEEDFLIDTPSRKRVAERDERESCEKEIVTPRKKVKVEEGLLRSRPILRDLVNGSI